MKTRHIEHDEQAALIKYIRTQEDKYPELRLLFAVPNGGKRERRLNRNGQWYSPTGNYLRDEGVKRGVPDLILPIARQSYNGLAIEMKTETGKLSKEQKIWHERLASEGWKCVVCRSWVEGVNEIMRYVDGGWVEIT